jgi:ribosomal protein L7/L12
MEQAVPTPLAGQEPKTGTDERVPQRPDTFENRLLLLMQAGKKIEAIKLYREETRIGLKEAKDTVEALAAGQPIARKSGELVKNIGVDPNSLEGQVLALMRDQKKIWAIKLYREQTGVGLKQAKDAVEALAANHGIRTQTGCAGMVLLLVAVSMILVVGMWALPG